MNTQSSPPVKNGEAFHAADVKSVAVYYDEYIGKPTSHVRSEHRDVKRQKLRARTVLGPDMANIEGLVDTGDFGGTTVECWLKLSDLNALDGALRKVISEHEELKNDSQDKLTFGRSDYSAPRLAGFSPPRPQNPFREFKAHAREAGINLANESFSHDFIATTPEENPILNTLFQTDASNPFQQRDPGSLSTLREGASPLVMLVPKRSVIGVQTEVKTLMKVIDTQAAGPRDEGKRPKEAEYAWEEFSWRVRDIAVYIRATDESFQDHPGMEDRVITDLMQELDIKLGKDILTGDGISTLSSDVGGVPMIGLAHAGSMMGGLTNNAVKTRTTLGNYASPFAARTAEAASREHDFGVYLNARMGQKIIYDSNRVFDTVTIFDNLLDGVTLIENEEILPNRMASHLVLSPAMITAMNKSRHAKASVNAGHANAAAVPATTADHSAEYVLGGPLSPRFGFMPWGLTLVPQTYSIKPTSGGNVGNQNMVGAILSNNRRNWELAVRADAEMRRGFMDKQLIEWTSTIAARLRCCLCIYDPAAFCILYGANS